MKLPSFPPENETDVLLWQILATFITMGVLIVYMTLAVLLPVLRNDYGPPMPAPTPTRTPS